MLIIFLAKFLKKVDFENMKEIPSLENLIESEDIAHVMTIARKT